MGLQLFAATLLCKPLLIPKDCEWIILTHFWHYRYINIITKILRSVSFDHPIWESAIFGIDESPTPWRGEGFVGFKRSGTLQAKYPAWELAILRGNWCCTVFVYFSHPLLPVADILYIAFFDNCIVDTTSKGKHKADAPVNLPLTRRKLQAPQP